MTRSKIEFATILAVMRGQGEDPKQLAEGMSLRKLCYEIEKLEQEQEAAKPDPPVEPPVEPLAKPEEPRRIKVRPFWSFLQGDSDEEDS
jgi:hypothetical protein